jgi:hypothetical protein
MDRKGIPKQDKDDIPADWFEWFPGQADEVAYKVAHVVDEAAHRDPFSKESVRQSRNTLSEIADKQFIELQSHLVDELGEVVLAEADADDLDSSLRHLSAARIEISGIDAPNHPRDLERWTRLAGLVWIFIEATFPDETSDPRPWMYKRRWDKPRLKQLLEFLADCQAIHGFYLSSAGGWESASSSDGQLMKDIKLVLKQIDAMPDSYQSRGLNLNEK